MHGLRRGQGRHVGRRDGWWAGRARPEIDEQPASECSCGLGPSSSGPPRLHDRGCRASWKPGGRPGGGGWCRFRPLSRLLNAALRLGKRTVTPPGSITGTFGSPVRASSGRHPTLAQCSAPGLGGALACRPATVAAGLPVPGATQTWSPISVVCFYIGRRGCANLKYRRPGAFRF